MLFTNFLCLLFLMVLSNSHTISKSIDTDDGIDEVSDRIIDLDDNRHHRIRRDRIHQKYRIHERLTSQLDEVTGADISKSAKNSARAYSDIITFNASTASVRHRSRKRKIGGLWKKFRGKNKVTAASENVQKRQVDKTAKHRWWKRKQDHLYFNPENRRKNMRSFIFLHPEISSAEDAVAINMPINKKNDNNVKFVYTPYIMYATELTPELVSLMDKTINQKTTENMVTAIAKMNTQINRLKKIYGVHKTQVVRTTATPSTLDYPGTAEIEELLTGIKMKAIQTVIDSGPSMVNVISNTVTEATFGVGPFNYRAPVSPRFAVSTLNIDNIFNNELSGDSKLHKLIPRSITTEPLSITTIEDRLEKEIKSIYRKMKGQVAKELPKIKQTFSTSRQTTTTTCATLLPLPMPMLPSPTSTPGLPLQPDPSTIPAPTTTTTPSTTPTTAAISTNNMTRILSSTLNQKIAQFPKSKSISHLHFKTTTRPPNTHQEKASEIDEPFTISRLVGNSTPIVNRTLNEESGQSADDYNMLNFYEQMLNKVQEDNAMKLAVTSNIQKEERYRLSKRNPETLTDIELHETMQKLYNDGIIIPDYDYLKSMSTPDMDDDREHETRSSTNYEALSKKIAYDDFVNGYKHYLKFQQEKAKADNFSAMVKYQAHRHHKVDDIGKYILDKIPQIPHEHTVDGKRLKRFFEDADMEDQEVSTKTDDSWFKKHFYIFLDYGPPKKFHTSQIVALKPPIADIGLHSTETINFKPSSTLSDLFFQQSDSKSISNKETTVPPSLDDLTKSLDTFKSTTMKSIDEFENSGKELETTTKKIEGIGSARLRGLKMLNLPNSEHRRQSINYMKTATRQVNATATPLPDRYKRANESIAEDFAKKDLEEKSSTPIREVQADVAILEKNKSETKFGCVDVNLVPVPTNAVNLHVNTTKVYKKNKFRNFLRRFHFKSKKTNKHKRSYPNRNPRFNPFKSLKKIFRPSDAPSKRKHPKKKDKSTPSAALKTKLAPLNFEVDKAVSSKKLTTSIKLDDSSELQREFDNFLGNYNVSDSFKMMPPDEMTTAQLGKPLTLLMMLDDGKKSGLLVQPVKFHGSTRKMKSPKRVTTKVTQPLFNDDSEILSVNVKTLKPLPSEVMKALTSSVTNETLPDLNLEIAKLQYGVTKNQQPKIHEGDQALVFVKTGTRTPLAKPVVEGLTFKNQLTRIAKLSLPFSKYLGTRQSCNTSDEFVNTRDYQMANDYLQESLNKVDDISGSTKRQSEDNSKNVDYFNDLLLWNNDVLNIDKVPHPHWKDIVKNVEKDFGATEYTTPNMLTMMHELKELDLSFGKPLEKRPHRPQSQSVKNAEDHNFEDVIRRVAMNDKALVKGKNVLIKGEQEYFQYNRPNLMTKMDSLKNPTTMEFPLLYENYTKFEENTFKAPIFITGDKHSANYTVECPFAWANSPPTEPPCACDENLSLTTPEPQEPISIFSPEQHIAWSSSSGKKAGQKDWSVTWTLENPITWSSEPRPQTKQPSEACFSKIARKFYIGPRPPSSPSIEALRPMRLTTEYDDTVQNKDKPKKLTAAKNSILGKAQKSANVRKNLESVRTGEPKSSVKMDKFNDQKKEFNAKETPALMVDTTLLSYDDEVETVTNGIDVKKLSRNSQNPTQSDKLSKSQMSRKSNVNVIARTSKRPIMYYSTPLPMKPSDFNKFLKEQGMDVESVISPLYGETRLYHSWTTPSKPQPMNLKKTAMLPGLRHTAGVKMSNFFSKYTTQINKLRHRPVVNSNKLKSKSFKAKNENISPAKAIPKSIVSRSHEIDRPIQASNKHRRIKKLKLFRQRNYDLESSTKPKDDPTEEKFSPELQAKLEHLQEPKVAAKGKPKSDANPPPEDKFDKSDTKSLLNEISTPVITVETYPESTTTAATSGSTSLVSTVQPEPDESMSDIPLELSGSIIFTSENPRNKDVDITIINFDDITKANGNDITGTETSHQNNFRLEEDSDFLKESRLNNRGSTNLKSILGELEFVHDATDAYKDTTYKDVQLEDPIFRSTEKKPFLFYYLNKLQRNQAMMNPKRMQISSHHYKYDIYYKNPDNAEQNMGTQNINQQQYHDLTTETTTSSSTESTTTSTSTNKANSDTIKKFRRRSHQPQRKWITVKSHYRYVRNVETPAAYANSDNEKGEALNLEEAARQRMKKGFFGFSPKIFIQDKFNLKRMNTLSKKNNSATDSTETAKHRQTPWVHTTELTSTALPSDKKTTDLSQTSSKMTSEMSSQKTSQMTSEMTSETTPSLAGLYNPEYLAPCTKLSDNKEGFKIQFGSQKIEDAVEKIKSMTTDDWSPSPYDIRQIPDKLGLLPKNRSGEYQLYLPSDVNKASDYEDDLGKKDNMAEDSNSERPLYLEYPEQLPEPDADQTLASKMFEESIFDKSMYGKQQFDSSVFEMSVFGSTQIPNKAKSEKTYANMLTDIMSYDITPDVKEKDVEYNEGAYLPEHVNVDAPGNTGDMAIATHNDNTTKKNYIFDSASIIYNKSYLNPEAKVMSYNGDKKEKINDKLWMPIVGNTLSVLFRNPLEGHLGFGLKPVVQVAQQSLPNPKFGQAVQLQMPTMPTPAEIVQAQLRNGQMSPTGWSQMPQYQNTWPQMQAASMGGPQMQTVFGSNETYGIYMEPGVFNYDVYQPIVQVGNFGHDQTYVQQTVGRNKKKNAKPPDSRSEYQISKHTATYKSPENLLNSFTTFFKSHTNQNPDNISQRSFTMCTKTNKKGKDAYSDTSKDDAPEAKNTPKAFTKQYIKRDLQGQDTYTAKDVAALEVIVDLMKNTLGYEEKDLGNIVTNNVIQPIKSLHQGHDSTNAIQVHIAIPYDIQNSKKRSPLEPMRVRKVFSAKMSTPVDLEYQVHSFEGSFQAPTTVSSTTDDGLSPGMYLLIDRPKNGYALKPVKTHIDFTEIKSRQAGNLSPMDFKGETTLGDHTMKNVAKVTLSKNFISAVNKQLVELYENLTKGTPDETHMRMKRRTPAVTKATSRRIKKRVDNRNKTYTIKRGIDWAAVKKFFGNDKVCNCKCKANKPMCRACAASDAVIDELTFEFDNIGKYMKDHCTEIQTYFWVNPSGGLKLRDAVDRIDANLRDYYKRSKGKCAGRTCEALGGHIEKKRFVKTTKVVHKAPVKVFMDDLLSIGNDLDTILNMKTCYNEKLIEGGEQLMHSINSCIALKAFDKRSDGDATKKKFVKNVYSLDNINVNIICNPEISSSSTESFEMTSQTTQNLISLTNPKVLDHTLTSSNLFDFEFDNFVTPNKRIGIKRFFLKRNNKKDKLFTYFTTDMTKVPKMPFKREADIPLITDTGGTIWLEYLRAATISGLGNIKEPVVENEARLDVAVAVQTNLNTTSDKAINITHESANDYTISLNKDKESTVQQTTTDSLDFTQNFIQILNLFDKLQNEHPQNYSMFSNDEELKNTTNIKSMTQPTRTEEKSPIFSQRTSDTFNSSKSTQKSTDTRTLAPFFSKISARTSTATTPTSSTESSSTMSSCTKFSAKISPKIGPPVVTSSDTIHQNNISSVKKTTENIYPYTISTDTTTYGIYPDSILSGTISPPYHIMSEMVPTDSDIIFNDFIPSDTFSQDSELTYATPVSLTDTISSKKVSLKTITPYGIFFQKRKSSTINPKVFEESKPQKSSSLPRTSLDFLFNINKDVTIKHSINMCPLNEIEKRLNKKKYTYLTSPSGTKKHIPFTAIENTATNTPTQFTKKNKLIPFTANENTEKNVMTRLTSAKKNNHISMTTVENKEKNALNRLIDKYYATLEVPTVQTTNNSAESTNSETVILRADMIKEGVDLDQKYTELTERTTAKSPTTVTTTATSTTTKKATRKTGVVKQGFLQRITSATKFLGLTNNFYLMRKANTSLGKPDVIIDKITPSSKTSSTPVAQFDNFSLKSTHGRPTVVIINDYDRFADSPQLDKNSEMYKNLLLSIIQYETNNLNDEWQKIAYGTEKNSDNKRSVTTPSGTSWKTTVSTNANEESEEKAPEQPKKKGLLLKLARRMGLNVDSTKKKAAHSPSNFSCSSNHSFEALKEKKLDLRQTTAATFCAQEDKEARINSKGRTVKRLKQKKGTKTAEASQVYPPSHTVCDLQATYNHVTQRCQDLEERTFEAYVKDVPCHMYKRLQRSFLITHKTRIPKWDWIRNKRSSVRFDKHEKPEESYAQYYEKYETFVKDGDGIYRIMERKKRDTSTVISHQLRSLPPLKPGKSEIYVMVGDFVTLDCPRQPQRSPYSQYTWGADPKDLLDCDNVHVDGFTLVIKKAGPRNAGRYSCSVDDVVYRSTKVSVMALPVVDVVFLPTYRTQQECKYDDLKAIQQLGREMSKAARCGSVCSIRIDEPMCQRDTVTNRSLIRSTGVLTMSPRRIKCSVQCRRDLFSSMLRLAIANIPSVVNNRVVVSKDGVNETLRPWDRFGRPTITHMLRKKDSSGHFEYHKFSTAAEPGQLDVVTLCHPGFYLLEEQHICAPCPANTSAVRGANRCSPCATGSWAAPGAAECRSVAKRLRRYDWWWYPPCGYILAFVGLVCACGVCMLLALVVHLGSRGAGDGCPCGTTSSACLERTAATKPRVTAGYMHSPQARPLSPSRVILARFFKQSLPSSRGTVFDSQETRFELWKEKNIPPLLPAIDFDIDTS